MKSKFLASIFFVLTIFIAISFAQTLSANGSTTVTANGEGNIGVLFPLVNGQPATQQQREQFVYLVKTNAQFIPINDVFKFVNGYDDTSPETQYGFWADGIWFRPVTSDCRLQIKLGSSNVLEYELVGNPNAYRPDPNTSGVKIAIGTPTDPTIDGWDLNWQDEFNGNSLDKNKWNIDIGVGQQGWGNQERQYYTDDPNNLYVADGKLVFKSSKQNRTTGGWDSYFNSGKVTSAGKYSWKYGRIDFRVKLPLGQGYWPALWMMPQKSVYGGWALSGEIDVMEAKGRLPNGSSGAIHFGGAWCQQPCDGNKYIHGEYSFPAGQNINDFNVYTLIWEDKKFSWYVNGNRFQYNGVITNDKWYTKAAPDNPLAPFDQEFFIIMNLAIGGHFDGFLMPSDAELGRTMEIDYVRVYKPGSTKPATKHNIPGNFAACDYSAINNGVCEETNIGYLENGSSVNYLLNVSGAGNYKISMETAEGNNQARVITIKNGETILGTINVPAGSSWTSYSIKDADITLSDGEMTLTISVDGAVNFKNFSITKVDEKPCDVCGKFPCECDVEEPCEICGKYPCECDDTPIKNPTKNDFKYGIIIVKNPVQSDFAEFVVRTPVKAIATNITIYDMTSNIVFSRKDVSTWDLRNSNGRIVANGTYLVVAEAKSADGSVYRYSTKLGINR